MALLKLTWSFEGWKDGNVVRLEFEESSRRLEISSLKVQALCEFVCVQIIGCMWEKINKI